MASIFRTLSLTARAFSPRQAMGAAFARAATPAGFLGSFSMVTTTLQQQVRGMKVHSSIKKRCEHCKVRSIRQQHNLYLQLGANGAVGNTGCSPQGWQET